jgi:adenylate cyclase
MPSRLLLALIAPTRVSSLNGHSSEAWLSFNRSLEVGATGMAAQRVSRRLAAVLAADVVGYSRLIGRDEVGTLAVIKARRKELLRPLLAKHEGRVFKFTGDGVLVEFASAVNAVDCAVALQQGMIEANASLPVEKRIELRIGINLGDVVVEGGDLFGDSVNIAARLQEVAQPNTICVTASVHDQVRGRSSSGSTISVIIG